MKIVVDGHEPLQMMSEFGKVLVVEQSHHLRARNRVVRVINPDGVDEGFLRDGSRVTFTEDHRG